MCRYCCKSLFALSIKNSKGYRRDVRVNMWGTSSPDNKLVSDLAKATEAIKIAARCSDRLMAGKLSPLNFGLCNNICHVWTAPSWQGFSSRTQVGRCSHVPALKSGRGSKQDIAVLHE